jgi:hypothetical protein
VLDCDLPRESDSGDGVAAYRKLEKEHGIVAGAAISHSGGGGLHVFWAPGCEGGKVGPGLSMRGNGLYAVLPPSRHTSGRRYRWERPPLASQLLPPAPEWVQKKQAAATKKLRRKLVSTDEKIRVNERHEAIAAYIGGLRRRNPALTAEEALVLAHDFRVNRCEVPEEKERDVNDLVAYIYDKDPPEGDKPWQGPVPEIGALLDRVEIFFRRFMIMGEHEFVVVALFVALTYVFLVFEIVCYLRGFSATKRAGKSRLGDLLELVVHAPLPSGGMSEAALFRSLAERPRTVLFDEIGKVLGESQRDRNSDLASVLLNGFQIGKPVQRCVGQGTKQTVVDFDVYGPKVLLGTGRLDDQILDRCFPIELRRKRKDERVERLRRRTANADAAELRTQLGAWADTYADTLRDARPSLPEELDDRGQDIAEPLLAIADLAGGDWPARARAACIALRGGSDELEDDIGVELLADIRKAFGDDDKRLTTDELLKRLTGDEERPWAHWTKNGEPMNAMHLARRLRSFGVKPKQLWTDGANTRGYEWADLEDAFSRYAPSAAPPAARPARPSYSSQHQPESDPLENAAPSGSESGANVQHQTVLAGLAATTSETGRDETNGDSGGALTPEQEAAIDAYFWGHGRAMTRAELRAVLDRYPELRSGLPQHIDDVVRIAARILEVERRNFRDSRSSGFCVLCRSHFCPHVAAALYRPPFTKRDERERATVAWRMNAAETASAIPSCAETQEASLNVERHIGSNVQNDDVVRKREWGDDSDAA